MGSLQGSDFGAVGLVSNVSQIFANYRNDRCLKKTASVRSLRKLSTLWSHKETDAMEEVNHKLIFLYLCRTHLHSLSLTPCWGQIIASVNALSLHEHNPRSFERFQWSLECQFRELVRLLIERIVNKLESVDRSVSSHRTVVLHLHLIGDFCEPWNSDWERSDASVKFSILTEALRLRRGCRRWLGVDFSSNFYSDSL